MIPFPDKQYSVIYADPPWEYKQSGGKNGSRGLAKTHYDTMPTDELCALPVKDLVRGGNSICFMWATFPNIGEALRVMQAWGFTYKTAAFVWVKQNKASPSLFWGMGCYTRANAEVCLLGIGKNFKASRQIQSHAIHQIVEAPVERHSKKPDVVRDKIVELMGNVPRIELFARETAPGWDAWGNEIKTEVKNEK